MCWIAVLHLVRCLFSTGNFCLQNVISCLYNCVYCNNASLGRALAWYMYTNCISTVAGDELLFGNTGINGGLAIREAFRVQTRSIYKAIGFGRAG